MAITARQQDDRLLDRIALRAAGHDVKAVCAMTGPVHWVNVLKATNAVRDADIAESGEPADLVAGCYW